MATDAWITEGFPSAAATQEELHPANLLATDPRPAAAPRREGQTTFLDLEAAVAGGRLPLGVADADAELRAGGCRERAVLRGRLQVAVAVDVGDAILGHIRYLRALDLAGQGAGGTHDDVARRLREQVAGAELGAPGGYRRPAQLLRVLPHEGESIPRAHPDHPHARRQPRER